MNGRSPTIGVFDSGVGGLSIAAEIHRRLPDLPLQYLADQAHVPYGSRPLEEIRRLSVAITRYLLGHGSSVIVVACNTASAAALQLLRSTFPDTPFVGMEPALKPAAAETRTGKVGVLATPTTFQGTLYASLLDRFASGVIVYEHTCPGLVAEIEAGRVEGPEARRILTEALEPMMAEGVDRVVLGCTHYPFVLPLIRSIAGPSVEVIDPAPAVARQVGRVLESIDHIPALPVPSSVLQTTGQPDGLNAFLSQFPELFNFPIPVEKVNWIDGNLVL